MLTPRYTIMQVGLSGFNTYDSVRHNTSGLCSTIKRTIELINAADYTKAHKSLQAFIDEYYASMQLIIIYQSDTLPTTESHPEFFI